MKRFFIVLLAMSMWGCSSTPEETLVLNYDDFGPQAASYQVLGYSWWQWDNAGDPQDEQSKAKVVVYRNMPLEKVQKRYPVDQQNQQDYRYLSYRDAIGYLNGVIEEDLVPQVSDRCRQTREVLMAAFDNAGQ